MIEQDLKLFDGVEEPPLKFSDKSLVSCSYGPSPCAVLQALTMLNASDGFNLERLETIGDSFLKYSSTVYLYKKHPDKHEGKLSFMRSKQISNKNLYRLGKKKNLGQLMVATRFEPNDNWLPPGYVPLGDTETANGQDNAAAKSMNSLSNLLSQHSIPDKSVADAVEALIGMYLLTYGPEGALRFMQWLGLRVLPTDEDLPFVAPEPLLHFISDPMEGLNSLWRQHNFTHIEELLHYSFRNKAYLVQAFTHASYYPNRVTDCFQRLEILGDAVLDYMVTRHLYQDERQYSPGVLTDLRSALVNNTIFASLGIKHEFHKHMLSICPILHNVIQRFVNLHTERQSDINFDEELYLLEAEEEVDDGEHIEVPKAISDVFEAVAGAIYLDSGESLDAVWRVYYRLMKDQIEKCCENPPLSPIRELMEMETNNVTFSAAEKLEDSSKYRVTVEIMDKGRFVGLGRNNRTAKAAAAKRALKYLKALARKREQSQQYMLESNCR